jgi:hypothetical protein
LAYNRQRPKQMGEDCTGREGARRFLVFEEEEEEEVAE